MPETSLYQDLRDYYATGVTRSVRHRKEQLKLLYRALLRFEQDLASALWTDLRKSREEAYAFETGLVLREIRHALKNLGRWARPEHKGSPMAFFPSNSYVLREPLGVVLIISPWNYPVQLLLNPLVGAIAAGNCALLKPSELAPATSAVLSRLIRETFPPSFVACLEGEGSGLIPLLMQTHRFDHVFFTGSIPVGREILRLAAPGLVPVTLELGGKSPVIVDETANLQVSARRIALGKFVNAGQTCVAPDYLLVHRDIKETFVQALKDAIGELYGPDPKVSPDYGRIVNSRRFEKLRDYLPQGRTLLGGDTAPEERYVAPTLLDKVALDSSIMQEEIFGPILPIFSFATREEALDIVRGRPWPLALYVFTDSSSNRDFFVKGIAFGGGCVNHTLIHFGNANLPVGGVGYSGIGRYHGQESFRTFSHMKSITRAGTWPDLRMRYPPWKGKLGLFRKFFH